jgi:hypothetical protein
MSDLEKAFRNSFGIDPLAPIDREIFCEWENCYAAILEYARAKAFDCEVPLGRVFLAKGVVSIHDLESFAKEQDDERD